MLITFSFSRRARRHWSMESELTFVAPEGVYTNTEEHKPTPLNPHIIVSTPSTYPTRLSTIVVHYPLTKHAVTPGLAHLLGGGKDNKSKEKEKEREKEKEKEREKEKDDGQSLSSSEKLGTDDDTSGSPDNLASPALQPSSSQSPTFFSSQAMNMGKKKSVSRPKRNIRTTTSTFVTRLQSAEGLTKFLQNKQGEVTYMFYNSSKNFFWTELGTKPKVWMECIYFFSLIFIDRASRNHWHA